MMSSMVLDKIGFKESATGRQFALRYAFVDASEKGNVCRQLQLWHMFVRSIIPRTLCPSNKLPMCNFSPPMVNFTCTPVTLKKWNPSLSMRSTSLLAIISKFSAKLKKMWSQCMNIYFYLDIHSKYFFQYFTDLWKSLFFANDRTRIHSDFETYLSNACLFCLQKL